MKEHRSSDQFNQTSLANVEKLTAQNRWKMAALQFALIFLESILPTNF